MKYTLTEANPDADRFQDQTRQIIDEEEVNKNVVMTRLEDLTHSLANWGRKNSLWPFNFGTSCCYVEYATTLTGVHDLSRFGAEVVLCVSSRQADVMIVAGTCFMKMAPVIQFFTSKCLSLNGLSQWVPVPIQAVACTTYIQWQGVDKIIPVDVYIPVAPHVQKP